MAPQGVIVGGWSYVIATYALSAVVLSAYAGTLLLRLRRTRHDPSRDPSAGEGDAT